MKKYIVFIFILLAGYSGFCETSSYINMNQKQAIDNKTNITFMGQSYRFGLGSETQNNYFLAGETPNAFSSLISIHVFKNNTDPLLVANGMYNKLLGNGQTAQLAIHRQSQEPTVTFILKNPQGLELNLWRFYRNSDHSEVIGMQYLRTFKTPTTIQEQQRIQSVIQTISEQFALLPKMDFIW